jgi:predicted Zn-dependent peptidase
MLTRARNQLLLHIYSQLEDNGSLASFLGEYIPTVGDPLFGFNLIQQIQNVTAADVARVAAQYLGSANRTVVIGTPQP